MPSFSRNIRKPAQAILLGVSATLIGAVSQAGDTHFTMTAFANVTGGEEILSGDYPGALAKLSQLTHAGVLDASAVSLNRCAALTMSQQWEAARQACDRAVKDAEYERIALPAWALQQRQLQDERIAIAYSNRAVLKWLTSDSKAAAADLQRARSLLPQSDIVATNVAALGARSTVAQVKSTPKS